jgi:hypothetical protein
MDSGNPYLLKKYSRSLRGASVSAFARSACAPEIDSQRIFASPALGKEGEAYTIALPGNR